MVACDECSSQHFRWLKNGLSLYWLFDCNLSRISNIFTLFSGFPEFWQCFLDIMDALKCMIRTFSSVRCANLHSNFINHIGENDILIDHFSETAKFYLPEFGISNLPLPYGAPTPLQFANCECYRRRITGNKKEITKRIEECWRQVKVYKMNWKALRNSIHPIISNSTLPIMRPVAKSIAVVIKIKIKNLTVLLGLMFAILKVSSYARSNGLHTTGVFEITEPVFGCSVFSVSLAPTESSALLVGFRVSKHIIISKQSSIPSFPSTLAACALSEFVKIYTQWPT